MPDLKKQLMNMNRRERDQIDKQMHIHSQYKTVIMSSKH